MSSIPQAGQADIFPLTRWTLVMKAKGEEAGPAADALNELCRIYRGPLLVYLEKRLRSKEEAEDMVQDYFESLLRRQYWTVAAPHRGRFRTFLLQDLQLFLKYRWRRRNASKRGADVVHLPLDAVETEASLSGTPWANGTSVAEASYHRSWALEVFDQALRRLASDYTTPRQRALFEILSPHLDRRGSADFYRQVGLDTGKSPAAIARQLTEMKQRFRLHLRSLVGDTVQDPNEVDDELKHLFRSLSAPATENESRKGKTQQDE